MGPRPNSPLHSNLNKPAVLKTAAR